MNSEQQYIDIYNSCKDMICANSASVLNELRNKAYSDFVRQGFPTKKVERYKYIDVPTLFEPNYGLNLQRLDIPVNPKKIFSCSVPKLSTQLYYVVNDQPPLSTLSPQGKELKPVVCSFRTAAEQYSDIIKNHLSHFAKTEEDSITALNTMLVQDGLFIYVPKGVRSGKTIQVLNLLNADVDLMVNRRVLIVVEDNASLQLLFCDHAMKDHNYLSTQVVEAYVGNNARLDLYCLEETNINSHRFSNLYIQQERDSKVNHNQITLHNGVTCNRLNLVFNGEGGECKLNGIVIADKNQFVDNNTLIHHKVGHCTSNELYKYVLNDESIGAFAGRVLVDKNAQKTISQETNQNICASRSARMFTQPMLEIYADDVKCSHGSTVGQLNEAALFYMQQRGISISEARLLLEHAFINEVIEKMDIQPLRDRLSHLVEMRFRGSLNTCEKKFCKGK